MITQEDIDAMEDGMTSGPTIVGSIERMFLHDRIEQLERELAEWKASQSYRYIGIDGKPVLARDLEDRAINAESELAAEKALADRLFLDLLDAADEICGHGKNNLDSVVAYLKARGL